MLILLCVAVFAQQKGSFTDPRDKKTYKTVKIGTQTWMAENLIYNASGSKCYDDKPANCDKYGRLYNWSAAMKTCPKGWHLPSDEEWQTLVDFAGDKIAGKKLKAKSGWDYYEEISGNGTDKYGFSALPGGSGNYDGNFSGIGDYGAWYSNTEYSGAYAYSRFMGYLDTNLDKNGSDKGDFYSVRCLQD